MPRPLLALLIGLIASTFLPGCTLPKRTATAVDGIAVVYDVHRIANFKPAVVFVHGWSCDRSMWRLQMPSSDLYRRRTRQQLPPGARVQFEEGVNRYSGRHTCMAMDLPGHGESGKPDVKYSMDLFARAVAAAMDEAGIEDAVLVGHSNGVPVVRQFYRLYPARVKGLVLVDGTLRPFAPPEQFARFIDPFKTPEWKEYAEQFVGSMLPPVKRDEDRKHIHDVMMATPQHVMYGALAAANDPAIWTEDPITVPVLMVHAKSPFWTADYREFAKRIAPDSEYVEWEGVSHFLMMDEPGRFNDTLNEWLKNHGL